MNDSTETERRLISAAIAGGSDTVAAIIAHGVTSGHFADADTQKIFVALQTVAGRERTTELAAIFRELDGFAATYGLARLVELDGLETTSARANQLADDVLALHRQRKLVASTAAAHEAAKRNAASWPELWDVVEPHLQAAQEAGADARHRSLADMATQAARWRLEPDTRPTTPTPWPGWDRAAGAPRGGELIVIAGRPGTGKTTLAGNVAHDVAARGQPVAFFSLEMSAEELVDRFSVRRAGRDGIGNDRRANVAIASQIEAVGKLKTLHIYEAEDAGTIAQIEANCRLLTASPAGLGAVVVDYLQLVTPPSDTKREVREQQVAAMSRRFKLLARAIGCPVFLCAQLNRESEKDERRPRLSDLRESGAIEQDADRVWFLYRPKIATNQLPAGEDAAEIDVALYQAKCRNGPGGIEAVLRFNRPTFSFLPA